MSTRPKHLGHVNLYVRNAERSKQWYEDVLGLHVYDFRPGWAAFMSADPEKSHEVALMQVGDDAPLQQKGQVGLNHLAWMMESLDDLKAMYRADEGQGREDRPDRRSRPVARHLFPRSGRQRAGGVVRTPARAMAAAGGRVPAGRGGAGQVPRAVGRRNAGAEHPRGQAGRSSRIRRTRAAREVEARARIEGERVARSESCSCRPDRSHPLRADPLRSRRAARRGSTSTRPETPSRRRPAT